MKSWVRVRLSGMMFLFYFALGAWAVTLSTYLMSSPLKGGLYFTTGQVGWIYSSFAFGGMLAPLIIGLLADRLFAAERVMGVSSLVCAVLLGIAASWCDDHYPIVDRTVREEASRETIDGKPLLEHGLQQGISDDRVLEALDRVKDHPAVRHVVDETFLPLFGLMFAYCFFLQISLTLTTVISFRNLPAGGRGFSWVRMVGTVGWVVAGIIVGTCLRPLSPEPLWLACGASVVLGVFSFFLPRTPPRGQGRTIGAALGLPALKLFRDRSFAVFILVSFCCVAMNQFYGVFAHRYFTDLGIPRPELVMTLGQVVEVGAMLAIPLLHPLHRLKPLMIVGLSGWVLRGATLTLGWIPGIIALGVPMHGWSFAFFFVVAASYLDREAPTQLRASAQGILSFASSGAGVWVGNMIAGAVIEQYRIGTVIDWQPVWCVPLVGCAIMLVVFVLFFHPPPERPNEKELEHTIPESVDP